LVGRDSEFELLRELWGKASHGEGRFVMLSGEAGIGKSRLVELLREHVDSEACNKVSCQCWPHFRNSALHPILDGLMRGMGIRPENPAPVNLRPLEEGLTPLGVPLADYVPLLASFLNIELSGPYTPVVLSPDLLKNRVLEAMVVVLLGLASRQPTLFVVE